jgi:hypothetical protein
VHEESDLDFAVEAFRVVGKEFGVL